MKGKSIKIYNLIFPIWLIILVPISWLVVLPLNFAIDSLILLLAMAILKIESRKQYYKRHVLKIFVFGMLSDILGSLLILLISTLFCGGELNDNLYFTLPAVVFSAGLIFVFNYFLTFKSSPKLERLKMALTFAILTAPYTFLIPIAWFF